MPTTPATASTDTLLSGRVYAITGALGGVGRHVVARFHAAGATVVLVDTPRAADAASARATELGDRASAVTADLRTRDGAASVVAHAVATHGRLDGIAHTVGGFAMGPLADATDADYDHLFDLNLRATFHTLVAALPQLEASPAGFFGLPKSGPYSAGKAACRVLLDTCRIEASGKGIRFVELYPGFTETPGFDPDDVPIKALVIQPDRASREMLGAIARGKSTHMFPKRIAWLMTLARLLPGWLRRTVLRGAA